MGRPHVLAVPYPAQGHVIPLMELSLNLIKHGFKVTFVNTEYIHNRVLSSLPDKELLGDEIDLVSVPDGLEPWEDRTDLVKLTAGLYHVLPPRLEQLINTINSSEDDEKIACVIADQSMGSALQVAEKMNIRRAVFWPASAAAMCLLFSTQKLVDDGVLDNHGTPLKNHTVQLTPTMPAMSTANFIWTQIGNPILQKIIFDFLLKTIEAVKREDKIICNSALNLEPGAFTYSPQILPIGPLLASSRQGHTVGNLWPEDSNCIKWLDKQPPKSVIYVAFGSFAVLDKTQFRELAFGLELSGKPFLWVVRADNVNQYPEGFRERVAKRGLMVNWAPQQKVLSHPSVACFLSHCGWNSTMEGVSNGVPFLCWPYFSDQFLGESYICDIWKVGMKFEKNECGIITRDEIKNKVEVIFTDENFRGRALELKKIVLDSVEENGHSKHVFKNFIEWIKE